MIDQDVNIIQGYPKLIDFGTAKVVADRTYSKMGTPQYMAPEIIQGKGYGTTADYWSLGIILYEFITGNVPFGDIEDPMKIYEKTINNEITFPSNVQNPALEFNRLLLNINPKLRNRGSAENLLKHAWFDGFEWVLYR